MKRKLLKPIYECRCNGRLQTNTFTRSSHTGLEVTAYVFCFFHFFSFIFFLSPPEIPRKKMIPGPRVSSHPHDSFELTTDSWSRHVFRRTRHFERYNRDPTSKPRMTKSSSSSLQEIRLSGKTMSSVIFQWTSKVFTSRLLRQK
jgi:hypothetical protein